MSLSIPKNYRIRPADTDDSGTLTTIIRSAFQDVAMRFNLNAENCPKHPSNCTEEWISAAFEKDVHYYLLASGSEAIGCVALERASAEVCYLERLAVFPQHRLKGFGKALAEYALTQSADLGAKRVEIGIIAAQTELRQWYQKLQFSETGRKHFPHLPFEVMFMGREL